MRKRVNYTIYKIENLITGKVYVGTTKNQLKERFLGHLSAFKIGKKTPLYIDMEDFGVDNFYMQELELIKSIDVLTANYCEKKWIRILNSTSPNGYNILNTNNRSIDSIELFKLVRSELKKRHIRVTYFLQSTGISRDKLHNLSHNKMNISENLLLSINSFLGTSFSL